MVDHMTGPLPFQNLTLLNSTHNEVHNFILQLLCKHHVFLKLVIDYKLTGICNIPEIILHCLHGCFGTPGRANNQMDVPVLWHLDRVTTAISVQQFYLFMLL